MSLLTTVNGRGTLAARPAAAAANEGYIYSASDASLYRSNGTSWDTIGGSGLADMGTATYLDFTTAAAPGAPAAGKIRVYSKTGDTLAQKTSGGTETVFGAGGGGSSSVLGSLSYSSGVDTVWKSVASAASTDVDAVNASLAITVPASGIILVMIEALVRNTVTAGHMWWDVRNGTTIIGSAYIDGHTNGLAFGTNYTANHPTWIRCSGLTPGAMTIKAGFRISAGTMEVYANNAAGGGSNIIGPFVMMALAA